VLADSNMPRLNGAELVQRVRAAGFRGRVVVVSGYLEADKLEELKKIGADAVLRKPFTPAKLLAAISG
jgi:CheY-like chemotaxis protein